jgi:two-component system, OmpR family, alkaline phosphatase synthesis response regulator PhoP
MSDKKLLKVLVVDDDRDILDLLEYNLEKEGFKVKTLEDSGLAIKTAKEFRPDLIILDIMMPHPNGIEVCRELRGMKRFEDTYIFFLTAKSESYFVQAALDTGGDDFIEKVIGLRALTYKVSSVLKKRFVIRKSIPELKIGPLKISRKSTSVKMGDKEIVLSKPEFELLFFFAQNPSKYITIDTLLHNIWGSEIYLFDTSIDVYIQNLSTKIGLNMIQRTIDNRYHLVVN